MKFSVCELAETNSTNDDAKRAAVAGEAEGLVVWALTQSAGRGRHGRQWVSPEGNLYCSVLLRPDVALVGFYSFVAALALYDTVREILPQAVITLKWPNDVLVGGKKISGILLEVEDGALIVGMGVNVRHFPAEALYPATSLQAAGAEVGVREVLDALLEHLGHWDEVLRMRGFEAVRLGWLEHAVTGAMSVKLPQGVVEGVFAGVNELGHLLLHLADGNQKSIATGDVFFNN